MRILFIHQNFPAQFIHLATALAQDKANEVVAFTAKRDAPDNYRGISLLPYVPTRGTTAGAHPWVSDFETKVIRGEALFHAGLALRNSGFVPDVVIGHPGWGECMFVKEIWPSTKLGMYCEFYYHAKGADVGFDPEFITSEVDAGCRMAIKNVNNHLHMRIADAGMAPTQWQASTFPQPFRSNISVIHDGIDCEKVAPDENAALILNGTVQLTRKDEIITFINRNLEPYRGYHIFMRALPEILKQRPHAKVLIVGADKVSYGGRPPAGQTWKQIFLNEVAGQISEQDMARVNFLGHIPYHVYVSLLQLSTVHVYLTYPFVLGWSLLEAMSAGCAIVGSNTAPVSEAIVHDKTGRLVDFFNPGELARSVVDLLSDPAARQRLGQAAREFALQNYDLRSICLPRQIDWVHTLAGTVAS